MTTVIFVNAYEYMHIYMLPPEKKIYESVKHIEHIVDKCLRKKKRSTRKEVYTIIPVLLSKRRFLTLEPSELVIRLLDCRVDIAIFIISRCFRCCAKTAMRLRNNIFPGSSGAFPIDLEYIV